MKHETLLQLARQAGAYVSGCATERGAAVFTLDELITFSRLVAVESSRRVCPPCDHRCNQGRDCPARLP